MQSHVRIGRDLLAKVPALDGVVGIVMHHHERWDGAGYPDGLTGGETPLGARIVAVVDAYDAMTRGDRPYTGPRTPDAAVRELRSCAGTQFDPVVVDAFCAAWAAREARAPAATS